MGGMGLEHRRLLLLIPVPLLLLLLPFWLARRDGAPPAHDPTPPRLYREEFLGSRYVNRDLQLSVTAPESWKATSGVRSNDTEPYEGLVVKMEPRQSDEPEAKVRPFVSVVKRSLPPGGSRDPVAYIRAHLLTGPKTVLEGPLTATLAGHGVGKVSYEMKSGPGTLRIQQRVYVVGNQAIILSAAASAEQFGEIEGAFEQIFDSLKLGL